MTYWAIISDSSAQLKICFETAEDELSEEDKLSVSRARKIQKFLSQPFDVAKVFTGSDGIQVPLDVTIDSFKRVVAGEFDHLPENAFYMVGGIDEVIAKAASMAEKVA